MTAITFDTHAFVKRLKTVGFTEEQAEVFAEEQARLIEDKLATKNDLVELENALRRDIKALDARVRETELKLEAKIADTKAELVRWVVGVGMLQITLIAALLLRLAPGG